MLRDVVIKTDGSCLNNGQDDARAGCAICVYENDQLIYRKLFKPKFDRLTNNRAELNAFYAALQFVEQNSEFRAVLKSDSKQTVEGVTGIAQRKANRDLWEPIEELFPNVHDRIVAVEHIASEDNNDADHLAFQAANALFINENGEWLI